MGILFYFRNVLNYVYSVVVVPERPARYMATLSGVP